MKNGSGDVLYIGISDDDIWTRWFVGIEPHINFSNPDFDPSPVGRKILDHKPASLDWKISLYAPEEAKKICGSRRTDLHAIEVDMIKFFHPILNTSNNPHPGQDTTPKSKRENERDEQNAESSKEIFG
jgi:hypothetical protein